MQIAGLNRMRLLYELGLEGSLDQAIVIYSAREPLSLVGINSQMARSFTLYPSGDYEVEDIQGDKFERTGVKSGQPYCFSGRCLSGNGGQGRGEAQSLSQQQSDALTGEVKTRIYTAFEMVSSMQLSPPIASYPRRPRYSARAVIGRPYGRRVTMLSQS